MRARRCCRLSVGPVACQVGGGGDSGLSSSRTPLRRRRRLHRDTRERRERQHRRGDPTDSPAGAHAPIDEIQSRTVRSDPRPCPASARLHRSAACEAPAQEATRDRQAADTSCHVPGPARLPICTDLRDVPGPGRCEARVCVVGLVVSSGAAATAPSRSSFVPPVSVCAPDRLALSGPRHLARCTRVQLTLSLARLGRWLDWLDWARLGSTGLGWICAGLGCVGESHPRICVRPGARTGRDPPPGGSCPQHGAAPV